MFYSGKEHSLNDDMVQLRHACLLSAGWTKSETAVDMYLLLANHSIHQKSFQCTELHCAQHNDIDLSF
jgi:hypothetical protein